MYSCASDGHDTPTEGFPMTIPCTVLIRNVLPCTAPAPKRHSMHSPSLPPPRGEVGASLHRRSVPRGVTPCTVPGGPACSSASWRLDHAGKAGQAEVVDGDMLDRGSTMPARRTGTWGRDGTVLEGSTMQARRTEGCAEHHGPAGTTDRMKPDETGPDRTGPDGTEPDQTEPNLT